MRLLPLDSPELIRLVAGWMSRKENYEWLDFGNGKQVLTPEWLKIATQRDTEVLRVFTEDDDAAPVGIVGYCMGGLLALALALRRRRQVGCLALLATPWDFHALNGRGRLLALVADCLARVHGVADGVPVEVIQTLFFFLDPFSAERKFRRFAALEPESDEARRFVALEDWINDGVPLALGVARDCGRSWYGDNEPARGLWRVAGDPMRPQLLNRPALVVVPGRDRIVPPAAAEPLAAALGTATILRPPLGHIGMMSALRAPEMLWAEIAAWLRTQLDAAKAS